MKTEIASRGRIVLPVELHRLDHIEPGQQFEVERLGCGDYRLVRHPSPANLSVVDWLLACPASDFFVPIESESTRTI